MIFAQFLVDRGGGNRPVLLSQRQSIELDMAEAQHTELKCLMLRIETFDFYVVPWHSGPTLGKMPDGPKFFEPLEEV